MRMDEDKQSATNEINLAFNDEEDGKDCTTDEDCPIITLMKDEKARL